MRSLRVRRLGENETIILIEPKRRSREKEVYGLVFGALVCIQNAGYGLDEVEMDVPISWKPRIAEALGWTEDNPGKTIHGIKANWVR